MTDDIAAIAALAERIKRLREGQLAGVACAHGWDTPVCPIRGCGEDEDELVEHLIAAATSPAVRDYLASRREG